MVILLILKNPKAIISIREFEHWMVVKGDRKEFLVSKELPYQTGR
jgi:hypothetical protein